MSTLSRASEENPAGGCAELRAELVARCDEAHRAKATHLAAAEHAHGLRRDLIAAQHRQEAAESAADPALRRSDKTKARDVYERARAVATDDQDLTEATANWARAIDDINRAGRMADRTLSKARGTVHRLEQSAREADRSERSARLQSEQAEAACLDARVRLAGCEEQGQLQGQLPEQRRADAFEPHAATDGHAVAVSSITGSEPLVIESLVSGDRRALELAASQVADHTGLAPAQAQLQLQELVDAVVSSAAAEGFLIFDTGNQFWSTLSFEESRDVIDALARLGFQFEPTEGWHAGRAPAPMDLSMALAYAGLDSRNMRNLPSADALLELPRSINVDASAYLAAQAPDLAVDHMVPLLGRRAAQLEPLWDAWGQVRPILLSPRHDLGSSSG